MVAFHPELCRFEGILLLFVPSGSSKSSHSWEEPLLGRQGLNSGSPARREPDIRPHEVPNGRALAAQVAGPVPAAALDTPIVP